MQVNLAEVLQVIDDEIKVAELQDPLNPLRALYTTKVRGLLIEKYRRPANPDDQRYRAGALMLRPTGLELGHKLTRLGHEILKSEIGHRHIKDLEIGTRDINGKTEIYIYTTLGR